MICGKSGEFETDPQIDFMQLWRHSHNPDVLLFQVTSNLGQTRTIEKRLEEEEALEAASRLACQVVAIERVKLQTMFYGGRKYSWMRS